jgi:hypothetical protein
MGNSFEELVARSAPFAKSKIQAVNYRIGGIRRRPTGSKGKFCPAKLL